MPVDKRYRMKVLESKQILKTERRPPRPRKVRVKPTTAEIVRAFKQVQGYDQIVARIPKAAKASGWEEGTEIAHFAVCGKTGAARWLDLWDADHFDGVSDMQHCISDCRAWFSHTGFSSWGSPQTATGRINCYFNAATAGDYSCVASLQSYPASSPATVVCLIDDKSFGDLPFTGSVIQPHFCVLAAGGHHFRIRQKTGSFFFLSLTVYRF
jgi:hypothetical protein